MVESRLWQGSLLSPILLICTMGPLPKWIKEYPRINRVLILGSSREEIRVLAYMGSLSLNILCSDK